MGFPLWLVGTRGTLGMILSNSRWLLGSFLTHTGWSAEDLRRSSTSPEFSVFAAFSSLVLALWTGGILASLNSQLHLSSGDPWAQPDSMLFVPRSGISPGSWLSIVTLLISCLSWVTALYCSNIYCWKYYRCPPFPPYRPPLGSGMLKLSFKIRCPFFQLFKICGSGPCFFILSGRGCVLLGDLNDA